MQVFCVALLLSLAALSAATCPAVSLTYAPEGGACSNEVVNFLPCQNSLFCINGTCKQVNEGDNCTNSDCGDGFLQCIDGKCGVMYRTVGDPCDQDKECLSGKCDNTTATCASTLQNGQACTLTTDLSSYGCPEACVHMNGSSICNPPIPVGGDCSAEWADWVSNPNHGSIGAFLPQMFCAAGSACILNATTGGFNCQRMFTVSENKPCQVQGVDGTCFYNLTCQPNATLGAGLYCQNYIANTNKTCTFPASATVPSCPFGQSCQCSATTANATCQPFVGGNLCTDYLTDFVNCVVKHGCPYTPALFPFTGGLLGANTNIFISDPFVTEAYPHTCVYLECRVAHANFLCCQNNHTIFNGAASVAAKFSPIHTPGDGYCKLNTGWPNWVIPVIVLSGIVVVVSVIVIIYVVARRRPDADYDPINK